MMFAHPAGVDVYTESKAAHEILPLKKPFVLIFAATPAKERGFEATNQFRTFDSITPSLLAIRRIIITMTRVSNTPASRPEVIQSLIDGVDRYNPDNVSILEEYLATQCTNKECDTLANLAILKL